MPDAVTEPIRRAGDAVADKAMRPALAGAVALLEPVNGWSSGSYGLELTAVLAADRDDDPRTDATEVGFWLTPCPRHQGKQGASHTR